MRLIWLFATLVVLASAGTIKESPKVRYDKFSVYKLNIRNKIQLALITKLSEVSKKVKNKADLKLEFIKVMRNEKNA